MFNIRTLASNHYYASQIIINDKKSWHHIIIVKISAKSSRTWKKTQQTQVLRIYNSFIPKDLIPLVNNTTIQNIKVSIRKYGNTKIHKFNTVYFGKGWW